MVEHCKSNGRQRLFRLQPAAVVLNVVVPILKSRGRSRTPFMEAAADACRQGNIKQVESLPESELQRLLGKKDEDGR